MAFGIIAEGFHIALELPQFLVGRPGIPALDQLGRGRCPLPTELGEVTGGPASSFLGHLDLRGLRLERRHLPDAIAKRPMRLRVVSQGLQVRPGLGEPPGFRAFGIQGAQP